MKESNEESKEGKECGERNAERKEKTGRRDEERVGNWSGEDLRGKQARDLRKGGRYL